MGDERGGGGFRNKLASWVKDTVSDIAKPSADVTGVHLQSLNLKGAALVFDVAVSNPYPLDLPLLDLAYKVRSGPAELFSGNLQDLGSIPAAGKKTIKIPISLTFANIIHTLGDVRPGALIPYLLEAVLSVDPPVLGRIKVPLDKEGELPIPTAPDVDVRSVEWGHLSFDEATANMQLEVGNKNAFDLGLKGLAYSLSLGGVPVVSASLKKPANISRGERGLLDVPISFRPTDLGTAIFNMIRGQGAGYGLAGSLDVDTPFGPLHLPFEKIGETIFRHSRSYDVTNQET